MEATARVLIWEGFDKASTYRIAEVAGVSVGSLYQYLPSKEALVAALIDRHRQDVTRLVGDELAETMKLPLSQAVRRVVEVAMKAHRIDPNLHRALTEQIPRVGRLEKAETFSQENYGTFREYLERHRDEIRVVDLELAAFICVTSIEALTHTAVLHREMTSDAATEALVEHATRLISRYLSDGGAIR
ncbi:MAG: TetR/AcrR family transcriptional regulator [Terriglobales bacterium]